MTRKLSVELDPLNGRVRVYPVPEIETPAEWRAFKEWLEGLQWGPKERELDEGDLLPSNEWEKQS